MRLSLVLPLAAIVSKIQAAPAILDSPTIIVNYVQYTTITLPARTVPGHQSVTFAERVVTNAINVYPTVTPTDGTTISTIIGDDLTIYNVLIPQVDHTTSSVMTESVLTGQVYNNVWNWELWNATASKWIVINYKMNITYTFPASCKRTQAFTTPVYIGARDAIADITPLPTITGIPWGVNQLDVYVDPSRIPTANYSSLSSHSRNTLLDECGPLTTSCYTRGTTPVTTTISGAVVQQSQDVVCEPDLDYPWRESSRRAGIISFVFFSIGMFLALMLVYCGIGWCIFSYKMFGATMRGQERKRGVPLIYCGCFRCIIPCCGPRWKARGQEEQTVLAARWEETKRSRRLSLWLKWGFRWRYPVALLGEEPGRANRSRRNREVTQVAVTTSMTEGVRYG